MEHERDHGYPLSSIREINILLALRHPSKPSASNCMGQGRLSSALPLLPPCLLLWTLTSRC